MKEKERIIKDSESSTDFVTETQAIQSQRKLTEWCISIYSNSNSNSSSITLLTLHFSFYIILFSFIERESVPSKVTTVSITKQKSLYWYKYLHSLFLPKKVFASGRRKGQIRTTLYVILCCIFFGICTFTYESDFI